MKFLKILLVFLIALMITYIVGPTPNVPEYDMTMPVFDMRFSELDNFIAEREAKTELLKPDNEARIYWAHDMPQKTPYSIVYLHGFSASPMEGSPVHTEIARRFGANLYLARLHGHGLATEESFLDLTPQKLMDSAKEALAIGKELGDSVILMSCSTGGTLSLYLAAHSSDVHSLILYSPNIDFARPGSNMLTKPWGLQLARIMFKGKYRSLEDWPKMTPYWTMRYRLEGLINLKAMVESTMTEETFDAIEQPIFLGYYFKNQEEQDDVVSVDEMLRMYGLVSTPPSQKRRRAFDKVNSHVMNSSIMSSDTDGVIDQTEEFCREILHMNLVPGDDF